jgi:hypothetical protein
LSIGITWPLIGDDERAARHASHNSLKRERTYSSAVAKAERHSHHESNAMNRVLNRVLPTAVAALTLIAASTQLSFAQPAPPENGNNNWQEAGRQAGPPPPPPPPQAPAAPAKFVFRRGLAAITCPQSVSLQDCVHAATELASNLSRIHAREQGNQKPSGGSNSDDDNSD